MKKSLPIFALFYSVLLFEPAFAAQILFNTNFGNWTNPANWSSGAVPTAVDQAVIDNNRQANLIAASANVDTTLVGWNNGNSTLLISNAGTLTNLTGYVGYVSSGNKAVVTGAGSLWINSRDFYVGWNSSGNNSLVISNGGMVASVHTFGNLNYGSTYIGNDSSTFGNSVLVTGTNSLLTNSRSLFVGRAGRGNSLTLADGGMAANTDGFIGYTNTASNNTVLVTGTGSMWTNSRDLYVGMFSPSNSLAVTNGGEVFAGGNLVVSARAGASNNSVSISSGRLVVTNGQIDIGRAGSGLLNVTGGTVEVKTLTATNGTNSAITFNGGAINSSATAINNGTNFTIGDTGSGAAFTARVGTHTFASDLVVGNTGSSNSLVITNGGEVFIGTNMVLSAQAGASNNSVSISSGRLVVTNGTLEIGRAGSDALLNVTGGTVEAKTLVATNWSNSVINLNGGAIVSEGTTIGNRTNFVVGDTGSGASFIAKGGVHSLSSDLIVGKTGSGNSFVITNGATFDRLYRSADIGYSAGSSNNSALVTGAGSRWANGLGLVVGRSAQGNSVVISNGGAVDGFNGVIGYNPEASNNSVLVTGTDSLWTNGGSVAVGISGSSNSLVVSNGGKVANTTAWIGSASGAFGNSALVTGTGSLWTNSDVLYVGDSGSGSRLVVSNAGKVANTQGYIGRLSDASNNSALVSGAGSVWTNSANLYVGESGRSNSLVIANGGEVFVATNLVISAQFGAASNSVTVEGGRLVVTNNGQINIGVAGSGALNVTGGTVEVKTLIATNGANSVLNFNGGTIVSRGTTISNATDFYVGDTGSGAIFIANGGGHNFASNMVVGNSGSGNSLIISNGSTMTNFRAWIGYNLVSSNNSVLVTGTNSLWTNRSSLRLGSSGGGNSLVISNGGRAFFSLGLISFFAQSSNNTVQVTGANSIMTSGNAFYFGYYGSASSLLVSNGGKLAGTEGYLGLTATASNNSALIIGANSIWTNSGQLWVGYEGISNSLTVSAGGTVAATNIVLGLQAGSSGTLNIGRFGTNDSAGTIAAPTIAFGGGTGVLNFNQSNATTITAAISGNGAVKQLGAGTTTLSASNTYTGDTTISAGTLRLSGENAAGGSRILQTTLASLVEFLSGGRMTNEMTAFQYSFADSFEAAGQVTLADAASSIAVSSGATVTGSGSFIGTGGLTKKGLGTLSLTAGNSFSGPLSVEAGTLALAATSGSAAASVSSIGVSNGAILLVSQSNQVNNSATVTLSGGTITRGSGVSETFGNLNLTQSSFLEFGSGATGAITFGTYAPSALLTINNFAPGNALVFGSDLTSTINNSSFFTFTNGGIGSSSWNEGTSTFTITAVPEPSTYVAAIGLLALMLWPLLRRLRVKVS